MEVYGQLFESSADAAELFEPADALFDDGSATVGKSVEPDRRVMPGLFIVLVRDHRLDLLLTKPVADARHAVSFIAGQFAWLVSAAAFLASASDQRRDRLADDRLGPRRFMDLSGSDFDGKWSARTVSDHVEFGAK